MIIKFYLLIENQDEGNKMKVTKYCKNCLERLAEKTCRFSHAGENVLIECLKLIDEMFGLNTTPPSIANKIYSLIRERTGIMDPYEEKKDNEVYRAKKAYAAYFDLFYHDLEGVIKFSALGNSSDTFLDVEASFLNMDEIEFYGELEVIEDEINKQKRDVLILGDNVSDFLFDLKLIRFLEEKGKNVLYAVKEAPVQNDLCIKDVFKYQFDRLFNNIISTGTNKVGIEKADIKGKIKKIWEDDAIVIAKGMGNYETISEFKDGKKVIHIMKVKCPAVSEAISYPEGSYVAIVR